MLDPATHPALHTGQIGVLVVEDDALLREDTCAVLTEAGLFTFPVADAEGAVALLNRRTDIQVMITDVTLSSGGMDGWQLVRLVAATWPQIGQLVVSGAEHPVRGALPSQTRFLPKPYRSSELINQVFGFISTQTGSFC